MKPKLFILPVSMVLCCAGVAHAATPTKSATGTDLTLAGSWSGGSGPGFPTSVDIATWDSTSLGAGLTAATNVAWGSINITGALTDIAISGAGTITTGNITLAGNRTLTIANKIALSGNTIYDIADVTSSTVVDATLSGVISGSFSLTKTGAGTLTLSGASTYSGPTIINNGILVLSNIGNGFVSAITVNSGTTLELNSTAGTNTFDGMMFNDGAITGTGTITKTGIGVVQYKNTTAMADFAGTLDIQAGTFGSAFTTGTLGKDGSLMTVNVGEAGLFDLRVSGANAAKIDKLTGTGKVGNTYSGAGSPPTLTIGTANGSSQFDGVIMGDGSAGTNNTANPNASTVALAKVGSGIFTLTGANIYTGGTTVSGGTLQLDFSGAISPTSNVLRNTGALTLGGGTLKLTGKSGVTNTQTVSGLTLNAGASAITLNQNAATGLNLVLNGITRTAGGTVNFTLPTSGAITTTAGSANTILTATNGAAYATVGSTDWAAKDATNAWIVGLSTVSGYTDFTSGTVTLAGNANLTGTVGTYTLGADSSPTTIRNLAAGNSVALGGFTLSTGGILSNSDLTITGTGSLRAALSGGDLILNQTAGTMTVNSIIANHTSASSLTKAGAGTLVLTGSNTYTGATYVNHGTLKLVAATSLASAITVSANGILELNYSGALDTWYGVAQPLSGTGIINKTGAGWIDVNSATWMTGFNGTLNIVEGTFGPGGSTGGMGGNNSTMTVNVSSGALFDIRATTSAFVKIDRLLGTGTVGATYSLGATITVGTGNGSSQFDGTIVGNGTSGNNSSINPNAAALNLTKVGTGTLTLTGTNTYTGTTTINGGTLKTGSSRALGSNSATSLANTSGVTLDVNGQNLSIGSLAGGGATGGVVILGGGTLTAGANNTSTSFGGSITGTGSFVKTGTGTLTLDYSNNSSKLSDTAALVLNGGTLTLSGGTHAEIVGSVTINGGVNLTRSSGSSTLALGNYTNTGLLNVGAAGIATTSVANNGSGYLDGVVFGGNDFAKNDGSGNIIAVSYVFEDVTRLESGTKVISNILPAGSVVRIIEGTGTTPASITINAGTTDIASLFQTATGATTTVDLTGGILRLGANGQILSAASNAALTIQNGTLTAGGAVNTTGTVNILNASSNAITISSAIADNVTGGTVSLKTAGTVTLSGTNTFTGGITVVGGALTISGTLGTSAVYAGSVANAGTLTCSSVAAQTLSGAISGAGAFIKSGSGTLTLAGSAANSNTGLTTLSAGSLVLSKSTGVAAIGGDFTLNNGTTAWVDDSKHNQFGSGATLTFYGSSGNGRFNLRGTQQSLAGINEVNELGCVQNSETIGGAPSNTGNSTLTLTGTGTYAFNGYLRDSNGTLALTKTGSGTQTLSGIQISYSGATAVNNGTLILRDTTAYNSATTVAANGTLEIYLTSGTKQFAKAFTLQGNVIKSGAGIWQSGAGTYTFALGAGTTLDIQGGTLQLGYGNSHSFVNNMGSLNLSSSTSTFDLWDRTTEVKFDGLSGSGIITRSTYGGSATLILGVNNGGGSYSGTILNGTGTTGLTKSGSGTQILSGANTYTGTTIVYGGKLIVNGSLGNSTVTVGGAGSTGTPTLGGSGTIGGATVIAAAGVGVVGIHAPGTPSVANGVGSQTFSGNLSYGSGSIFEWDINTAANSADSVSVGGTLAVSDGAIFKVISSTSFTDAFWNTTRNWNVFGGKDFDAFALNYIANGQTQNAGDFATQGNFTFTNNGSTLTWTAVPEPGSALAGLLLGAGWLRRRRK